MTPIQGRKVQVVIIYQGQPGGELLLLQTSERRGGFWQNVTGKVEEGEDLKSAAQRELQEETGILFEVLPLDHHFIFRAHGREVLEEHSFLCLVLGERPVIITDPQEHQNHRWISLEKVKQNFFAFPSNYEAFQKALEKIKKGHS
jgi:lipoyl(octanoyl) transferase